MHRYYSPATLATPLVALLLVAGPTVAQQDDQDWLRDCERQAERSERAVFCEVRPLTVQLPAGRLAVEAGQNGGVVVRGGQVPAARVSARVQARARSDARAQEIAGEVAVHATAGELRTTGPRTSGREGWSVSYHVTVPHRTDLELTALNGPIGIHDVTGRMRATTTNGPLALNGLAGDVRARTTNGPLTVTLTGTRWEGEGVDAETVNGPLTLVVPEGYSADLETGTINGPLNLDFPVTVTLSGRPARRLRTTLGSGGAPVRVVTTNGPAILTRGSGGDRR